MSHHWVTIRADLPSRIEFFRFRDDLRLGDADALLLLYRAASWFQIHGNYGKLKIPSSILDYHLSTPGLSLALISIGWLREHDGVLTLHWFCTTSTRRKSLGKKLRQKILAAGECAYCGSKSKLQIDHIVPIVLGGSCDESNLQALCEACNKGKGQRLIAVFEGGR